MSALPRRSQRAHVARSCAAATSVVALAIAPALAQENTAPPIALQDATRLPEVIIEGRDDSLLEIADAANEGQVGARELAARPLLRPAELLETVPGVIVTQHSGSGKANQFFLRGFNLDHGTDLATRVNGIPINLPTHGHGQGYTDLNFVVPELVEAVQYKKGPYFAREGDFASAGSVGLDYFRALPHGIAQLEAGSFDYQRALIADSFDVRGASLLYAFETQHSDGPWVDPDDFDKVNGVLRWSEGDAAEGATYTLLGYHGEWNATDQIAERAVEQGLIGRFDSLDPTDGGDSNRYALSGEWRSGRASTRDLWLAYTYYYDLALYSNFTYFLDDPVNGDQFLQRDQRVVSGLEGSRTWDGQMLGESAETTLGVQLRNDVIDNGLFHTRQRDVLSTTRADEVLQTSAGVYAESKVAWTPTFRTTAGVRGDVFRFDVDSDNDANSGEETDAIASPKLGVVFGPFSDTEIYVNGGLGFHSNDGRGVLTSDDPTTPAPNDGDPVDPLVRTRGAEVGVRTLALEGLQSTLSLWVLDSDSELVFVGDAGNTEASRPSRRFGVEWANFYEATDALTLDLDVSLSRARFRDDDPAGDHVPGSVESVVAAGVTTQSESGWFGALRVRSFGARPLIEDDSVRSDASTLVNAEIGYRESQDWSFRIELLNLFDREVDDIAYYYPSLLPGEAPGPDDGGYDDVHFHPAEPFAVRFGFSAGF